MENFQPDIDILKIHQANLAVVHDCANSILRNKNRLLCSIRESVERFHELMVAIMVKSGATPEEAVIRLHFKSTSPNSPPNPRLAFYSLSFFHIGTLASHQKFPYQQEETNRIAVELMGSACMLTGKGPFYQEDCRARINRLVDFTWAAQNAMQNKIAYLELAKIQQTREFCRSGKAVYTVL